MDNATLFIDASKECDKIANSNKLTQDSIEAIYAKQADKQFYKTGAQWRNRGAGGHPKKNEDVKINAEIVARGRYCENGFSELLERMMGKLCVVIKN